MSSKGKIKIVGGQPAQSNDTPEPAYPTSPKAVPPPAARPKPAVEAPKPAESVTLTPSAPPAQAPSRAATAPATPAAPPAPTVFPTDPRRKAVEKKGWSLKSLFAKSGGNGAKPARKSKKTAEADAPASLDRVLARAVGRGERIRPGFSGAWVLPELPPEARVVHEYDLPGCKVRVCKLPASTEGLYHITPEEYNLQEDELTLLLAGRDALANEYPESLNLTSISQTREYVIRRGAAILADFHDRGTYRIQGSPTEARLKLDKLARILARYTAGYGVLEILLSDPVVSDIYINAPAVTTPVRVTLHTKGDMPQKCRTNVNLGKVDEDSLLSRLRYESGRPFSEAYPVMDADLSLFGARAAVIGPPLSPEGLAVALRRHSLAPWTLLRLIDVGAIDALTAGLLSTLIQGQSTLIIAGGRGAGKTSLLSALLFEIPVGNRILTVEDTPEIPVPSLQENGYQVQSLTVRSSVGGGGGGTEMTASDALKIAMRLGESAIVMGEVRGEEAKTLYESMRAGSAGSTVLGTFHGDSAASVFQRAVYDMGISAQSFAATDAVVIAGLVKRGGTSSFARRLVQIAEFDKRHPEAGVFHDLLHYDVGKQDWVVTDHLQRSSGLFSSIGAKWGLGYFDTMRMVETRASVYAHVVNRSRELGRPALLGASAMPRIAGIVQERLQAQPLAGADFDAIIAQAIEQVERQVIQA